MNENKTNTINKLSATATIEDSLRLYLLVVLLGVIVFVVRDGKQQVISLNAAERIVQAKRLIVNRTFEQLLGLSFSDDLLLSGNTAALAAYRTKRLEAVATLNKLKTYLAPDQQTRIDSVCKLLGEKEQHLWNVLETLSAQDETDELIRRRILIAIPDSDLWNPVLLSNQGELIISMLVPLKRKFEISGKYSYWYEVKKQIDLITGFTLSDRCFLSL